MITAPGTYDIPMSEYLALPHFSSSVAIELLTKSPMHAKHYRDDRMREHNTKADIGTCFHSILLEGREDCIAVINPEDYPSKPTKANPDGGIPKGWTNNAIREARDNAVAEGKTPVLLEDMAGIRRMVDAAANFIQHSPIAQACDNAQPEPTVIWDEEEIICKARPDKLALQDNWLIHVKTTTGSAQPEAWIRNQLVPYGYDVAAAFYERGIGSAMLQSVFLVVEQQAPFGCSLIALSPAMMSIASAKVDRAITTWQRCVKSGKYPAYPTEICYAEPTAWQLSEAEERDLLTKHELAGGIPA